MALALGVAAMFFGVVFIIVGWKGGGTNAMNSNLVEMMKGNYPLGGTTGGTPSGKTGQNKGATSTTGGTHAPGGKF